MEREEALHLMVERFHEFIAKQRDVLLRHAEKVAGHILWQDDTLLTRIDTHALFSQHTLPITRNPSSK